MNHSRILVLGCGPSGLMVAHACSRAGVDFEIMSDFVRPSFISGAQYLHSYVPGLGLEGRAQTLRYERRGTADGYRMKIYGEKIPTSLTSWGRFPDEVSAYPLREAYDRLWDMYHKRIIQERVDWGITLDLLEHYGAVFSTVPLVSLAPTDMKRFFEYQDVWILPGDVTDEDFKWNTIVYSGQGEDEWYRKSDIWGHLSVEYSMDPEMAEATKIRKPLRNMGNDPCPQVYKFGRYGTWNKQVLVDDAYKEAVRTLSGQLDSQSA